MEECHWKMNFLLALWIRNITELQKKHQEGK